MFPMITLTLTLALLHVGFYKGLMNKDTVNSELLGDTTLLTERSGFIIKGLLDFLWPLNTSKLVEVILSGMSNETLTVNTELKPISSCADRLLGATVCFKAMQGHRGQGTMCACVCCTVSSSMYKKCRRYIVALYEIKHRNNKKLLCWRAQNSKSGMISHHWERVTAHNMP